ncbi:MAG: amidase [Cyclobacteriaceae bacterium]|nr:amidase [Cyclobacteriaceae bacterium]
MSSTAMNTMENNLSNRSTISRRRAIGILGLSAAAIQFPYGCSGERANIDADNDEPIYYKTLAEISALIKLKKISSVALTQTMLNRIGAIDKKLNSYITVMDEAALAAANKLDQELASGKYRGPLHGVPIAVKDLLFTTNAPTTGGHAFKSNFVPAYNATVVNRLQDAGAVILGKLNLTEGAMGGYHSNFKIPVNPWGEFWAGDSSSGPGVATAAGLCFGSIGTDTGGSIRFPSMANGIVGLKPTYGLVSRYGVLPLAASLDHVGPMTRSTEDAAIMLEAIAGYDANDPTTIQDEVPDIRAELKSGVKGLRVGVDQNYLSDGVEPYLVTAIENAIQQLEALGAIIVQVKIPGTGDEHDKVWFDIASKEALFAHKETYPSRRAEYGEFFRDFLDFGQSVTDAEYAEALSYRLDFKNQLLKQLSGADAIAAPAGGMVNVPDEKILRGPMSGFDPYLTAFDYHFGLPANLAGIPALTLPCGQARSGAPLGFQLMGGYLGESVLCRMGYAYEQVTNWHDQHPNI